MFLLIILLQFMVMGITVYSFIYGPTTLIVLLACLFYTLAISLLFLRRYKLK